MLASYRHAKSHGCGLLAALMLAFTGLLDHEAHAIDLVSSKARHDLDATQDYGEILVTDEMPPANAVPPNDDAVIQRVWDRYLRGSGGGRLWTGSVDALLLWQGNVPSLPIFTDATGGVGIDANQALPGASAGPRFGLMRKIGCNRAIEGNYFLVEPFNGSVSLPTGGAPFTISDLGGLPAFGDIATGSVATSGQIQSAELNVRFATDRSISWLGGFRWVQWDESMNIDYTFENPVPFGTGSLRTSTGNNLYGAQLGADACLWNRHGRFRLNGIGKAGVFYNSAAYQRSAASFTDEFGALVPVGAVSATADETAFFGEVGLNATTQLTKSIAWRLGYNIFWLSGVATAPQQFAVSDIPGGTAGIDTKGSVLLHGVNTGIEARW